MADIEVAVTDRLADPLVTNEDGSSEATSGRATELDRLQTMVDSANGKPEQLRVAFFDLVARVGHDQASQLWWAVFAAQDAPRTG